MSKKITITRSADGSKKVIIGTRKQQEDAAVSKDIKVSEPVDRRPKPGTPKISISNEKNGYKYGGKLKLKTR